MTARAIDIKAWRPSSAQRWRVRFDNFLGGLGDDGYIVEASMDTSDHPVRIWIRENTCGRVVIFPNASEVYCEDEEDAMLLFMAFR